MVAVSTTDSVSLATGSPFAAHAVEPLGEAAFFHKVLFHCGYLAVEQAARYREQRQCAVSRYLWEGGHRGLGGRCGLRFSFAASTLSIRPQPVQQFSLCGAGRRTTPHNENC